MEKVINKKTGIVKEISKELLSDYLSTKEWEVAKEEKQTKVSPKTLNETKFEIID